MIFMTEGGKTTTRQIVLDAIRTNRIQHNDMKGLANEVKKIQRNKRKWRRFLNKSFGITKPSLKEDIIKISKGGYLEVD